MTSSNPDSFRALIAGGGVAALEAALALCDLAADKVSTTVLVPDSEFVYRPLTVREPFGYATARHYSIDEITRDIGAEFRQDAFRRLDATRRIVHTESGEQLEYDALLLALGARTQPRFQYALTLDDRHLDEQLHGLLQDVEEGYVHELAFLVPSPVTWPLPIYELALMTANRAYEMNADLSITIVTPEDAPLTIFGTEASDAVLRLLQQRGIRAITSVYCETPEPGHVSIRPRIPDLRADRILALPELTGPFPRGVHAWSLDGFISVDDHCQVRSLDRVYAAGDATAFVVKHGGIAAQQADAAAESIAALAGGSVEPKRFSPVIYGILLNGQKPLYLSAHITDWEGLRSQVATKPIWWPATKIAAKYLGPYLDGRDRGLDRRDREAGSRK